ncbi:MAG: peptide chain release factor N(5)-glutamine methyltransferase [Holosporales bacterium]|nr:peptide chain release factor N(5)-glutamine methyltransferase [Holosporales bacterium]
MLGKELFAETVAVFRAARIESATAAARALVSFVLDREDFREVFVSQEQKEQLLSLITQHRAGCPVSKLIKRKYFWDHPFFVNTDVLDPRPESETLIEAVLHTIPKEAEGLLLDFGTGSGCLLETLLLQHPHLRGLGVDCSFAALQVAQENARRLGVLSRSFFLCSDWGAALNTQQKFRIIVANPPYIARHEISALSPSVLFDPLLALQGGEDGYACYRTLAPHICRLLSPQGHLFLEIGNGQGKTVKKIFNFLSYRSSYKDLSGKVRVLYFSP